MKFKYLFPLQLIIILGVFSYLNAQDIEKANNDKLQNVLNYLNSATIDEAEIAITRVIEIKAICPEVEAPVDAFEKYRIQAENNISEKHVSSNKDIDLSVSQIRITGVVESKEKGYAIVNSNGSYYAIKTDLNVGSSFSGSIKQSKGKISYKPLGGNSYSIQTYTIETGTSPKEKYTSMTNQLESYKKEYEDEWNKFKSVCIASINTKIEEDRNELLESHYLNGEVFLKNKEYDNAYKEFNYIYKIDKNYKDVSQKLELSNNKNNVVKKSDVYNIVNIKKQNVSARPDDKRKATTAKSGGDSFLEQGRLEWYLRIAGWRENLET